jgi:hypothetical protein
MKKTCLLHIISVFLLFSCTIDDDDRCPDGYEYLPDQSICYEQVDGSTDLEENFGDVCDSDEDCADGTADYCLIQFGEDEGICTYTGCESDDPACPDTYFCANCTQSGIPGFEVVVCLPDDMADSAFIQGVCVF